MKVRHQMEDTQRSDALKLEQLCIENRMLRAQLEEERASIKGKDRIILTERERHTTPLTEIRRVCGQSSGKR